MQRRLAALRARVRVRAVLQELLDDLALTFSTAWWRERQSKSLDRYHL